MMPLRRLLSQLDSGGGPAGPGAAGSCSNGGPGGTPKDVRHAQPQSQQQGARPQVGFSKFQTLNPNPKIKTRAAKVI